MSDRIASYATLKNQGLLVAESETHFRVERHFLIDLMASRLAQIRFDETWYLNKYPDVRDAVRRGSVASGREHYLLHGYFEGRMPTAIAVTEKWYLSAYPDVAEAIRRGVYKTAQAHFDLAGYREGRLPYANFQL